MPTPRTLVVVPALDEAETVGAVVERVRALALPVLVVDDGSTDATADRAGEAGASVIRLPVNLGVGAAMRAGFRWAVDHRFARVAQVDGDLQHPPEALPDLLAVADTGVDLVIGSRFAAGYEAGRNRRVAMRMLARSVSRRVGVPLDDVTSGFRVITEPLLSTFARSYPAEYLGDTVEAILQAHAAGATIAQVPVPMSPRAAGSATSAAAAGGHLARMAVSVVAGKPQQANR